MPDIYHCLTLDWVVCVFTKIELFGLKCLVLSASLIWSSKYLAIFQILLKEKQIILP